MRPIFAAFFLAACGGNPPAAPAPSAEATPAAAAPDATTTAAVGHEAGCAHEGTTTAAAGHGAHGAEAACEHAAGEACDCGKKDAAAKAEGHCEGEGTTAAAAPASTEGWDVFGESFPAGTVVAAKTVLDNPKSYVGQSIVVEGEVQDVCQKAGCWMVVTDGSRTMRVTMKAHGFAVAKDGAGKLAQVSGQMVERKVDPATVAHYKSESAKPDAMPENKLPADATVTYEIVASAVKLKKST